MKQQRRWQFFGGLGFAIVLTGCQGSPSDLAQRQPIESAPSDQAITQVLAPTLVQAIAQTEVDLILKKQQFTADSPQISGLQEQKRQLLKRLALAQSSEPSPLSGDPAANSPGSNSKTALNYAIRDAVSAKIAELELQHIKAKAQYSENHPALMIIQEQLQSLRVKYQQVSDLLATPILS
jgi:hypothetical protein